MREVFLMPPIDRARLVVRRPVAAVANRRRLTGVLEHVCETAATSQKPATNGTASTIDHKHSTVARALPRPARVRHIGRVLRELAFRRGCQQSRLLRWWQFESGESGIFSVRRRAAGDKTFWLDKCPDVCWSHRMTANLVCGCEVLFFLLDLDVPAVRAF